MGKTVWKIAERNVLSTGISGLRLEGGYKLIAGYSRKRVSELAGKAIMPVLIWDLDNDKATIILSHSIFQCQEILLCEKALAYEMKLETLKYQGSFFCAFTCTLGLKNDFFKCIVT